jgi:Flp pilus assembly protein TadB
MVKHKILVVLLLFCVLFSLAFAQVNYNFNLDDDDNTAPLHQQQQQQQQTVAVQEHTIDEELAGFKAQLVDIRATDRNTLATPSASSNNEQSSSNTSPKSTKSGIKCGTVCIALLVSGISLSIAFVLFIVFAISICCVLYRKDKNRGYNLLLQEKLYFEKPV